MTQGPVSIADLKPAEAIDAAKTLVHVIDSFFYTAPDDTAKTALLLNRAATLLNQIATALCIIKPEGHQS